MTSTTTSPTASGVPARAAVRAGWPLRTRVAGPAVTAALTGLAYVLWGWR